MQRLVRYRIAVALLLLIVIIQGIFIIISRPKKAPLVAVKPKGKIAIVIDDWGYNLNNLPILKEIKYPLTLSVLPHLSYSKTISAEAHNLGKEVILHLPMEPLEKLRLEKSTVSTTMDEASIVNIIEQDLANVTYAKGVSNHMGSKATQDARTMTIVFKELKKRGIYFLDSFVTPNSAGQALSEKMHIRFAARDIFLDNKEESQYIMKQINRLKLKAAFYGQAIGIGHDRKSTLEVLKEVMPQLEKEGYRFVYVSELVR